MPTEMSVWRIDEDHPRRLPAAVMPSERSLEDFLDRDPSLLGTRLLVIGRQVRTPQGKYVDLLAIDADGTLHVLELKRDKTPRDVVAQVLDYGSWVTTLGREDVIQLATSTSAHPSRRPSRMSSAPLPRTSSTATSGSRWWRPSWTTAPNGSSPSCAGSAVPVNAVFLLPGGRGPLPPGPVLAGPGRGGVHVGALLREEEAGRVERPGLVRLLRRRVGTSVVRREGARLRLRRRREVLHADDAGAAGGRPGISEPPRGPATSRWAGRSRRRCASSGRRSDPARTG